jgi:hypothetical protein
MRRCGAGSSQTENGVSGFPKPLFGDINAQRFHASFQNRLRGMGMMFELIEYIVLRKKFITMTTTTKVILGLIGAAAVGAAVGMLLAPEKGSDLRKNISDTAGKWSDKLSETLRSSRDGAKRAVSQVQSEM